jgi:hypothetical protein
MLLFKHLRSKCKSGHTLGGSSIFSPNSYIKIDIKFYNKLPTSSIMKSITLCANTNY